MDPICRRLIGARTAVGPTSSTECRISVNKKKEGAIPTPIPNHASTVEWMPIDPHRCGYGGHSRLFLDFRANRGALWNIVLRPNAYD